MARIDTLLFGYREFRVKREDSARFAAILLRLGIPARVLSDGHAKVRLRDCKALSEALNGVVPYEMGEICGLPGFLYRNRHKYGTFLGFLLGFAIVFYSSGAVWDVRVIGTEEASEDTLELLDTLGLSVGARWSDIDKNALEAELLKKSDRIAWLNINRRGTVAYVTVKQKDSFKENGEYAYANVIASCDAVIEEINVRSGHAVVKVGDAVKKGDLLISGVIPGELGGGFVKAEGDVIGRITERYSCEAEREVTFKEYISEETQDISYKILGFSINILKNSGNLSDKCDIIEYDKDFMLFDRYKLPIRKHTSVLCKYQLRSYTRSTDELVEAALSDMAQLLRDTLISSELLAIRTDGEFTENGYLAYSDVTYTRSIGSTAQILTDG